MHGIKLSAFNMLILKSYKVMIFNTDMVSSYTIAACLLLVNKRSFTSKTVNLHSWFLQASSRNSCEDKYFAQKLGPSYWVTY